MLLWNIFFMGTMPFQHKVHCTHKFSTWSVKTNLTVSLEVYVIANNGYIGSKEKRMTLRDTRNFASKFNIPKSYQQMVLLMPSL